MILNNNDMKTNKLVITALGFFGGIIFTVSMMGIYAFSEAPAAAAPGGTLGTVSASVANTYFKKYIAGAITYNQVIKGFAVDKSQLDAMNNIAKENAGLVGFRIYFGKDNDLKPVSIVVGVDAKGLDAVTNTIYTTNAPGSPCPTVCDNQSPIIQN